MGKLCRGKTHKHTKEKINYSFGKEIQTEKMYNLWEILIKFLFRTEFFLFYPICVNIFLQFSGFYTKTISQVLAVISQNWFLLGADFWGSVFSDNLTHSVCEGEEIFFLLIKTISSMEILVFQVICFNSSFFWNKNI